MRGHDGLGLRWRPTVRPARRRPRAFRVPGACPSLSGPTGVDQHRTEVGDGHSADSDSQLSTVLTPSHSESGMGQWLGKLLAYPAPAQRGQL